MHNALGHHSLQTKCLDMYKSKGRKVSLSALTMFVLDQYFVTRKIIFHTHTGDCKQQRCKSENLDFDGTVIMGNLHF
jgi:hypothetical protein